VKRGLSIAELIRQDVLDLHPEPPRPPCPIPPRLLILACSATKATGEGRPTERPLHPSPSRLRSSREEEGDAEHDIDAD
jgi:hypothetical protein